MSEHGATVIHVDLDAFYVSMELLRQPELRGKPVVVAGGLGNRGVVNTCSYEARAFGVRSAMPVAQARHLCPHAVYLPSDFRYYHSASKAFHAILRDFTPMVEPAGADEAYLDVRGCDRLFGEAPAIAETIRRRVRDEIGITASAGVSTNKLVSKVASDAGKPDGLVVVPAGGEAAFLAPRPLRELPMIGPKTAAVLTGLGIRTIGELAAVPVAALEGRFGQHGRELHDRALGRYDAPVLSGRGRNRSISRETTFDRDEASRDILEATLLSQAERVAADLERAGRAAGTVTIKLRFPPFETLTRSHSPAQPVALVGDIFREGWTLLEGVWRQNDYRPVRLVGIGVTNLRERALQLSFDSAPATNDLARAVTSLRDRFGDGAIRRGAELWRRGPERSGSPASAFGGHPDQEQD